MKKVESHVLDLHPKSACLFLWLFASPHCFCQQNNSIQIKEKNICFLNTRQNLRASLTPLQLNLQCFSVNLPNLFFFSSALFIVLRWAYLYTMKMKNHDNREYEKMLNHSNFWPNDFFNIFSHKLMYIKIKSSNKSTLIWANLPKWNHSVHLWNTTF